MGEIADNLMLTMLSRKRKANFTKQELEVLVANVQARKDVLFTKRNTPVSNQAKQHAWDCIARKVNSVECDGGEDRTVNDVRRKWVCLLSETKKAELQRRRRIHGSSGGPSSGLSGALAVGIGFGEYTPLLAEAILNISQSVGLYVAEGKNGRSSSGGRDSIDDANDLSLSSPAVLGGMSDSFTSSIAQISHGLSSSNHITNRNTNDATGNAPSYLQVSSVYPQSIIDDVEEQLNESPSRNAQSPTLGSKTVANIVSNIKSLTRQTANLRNNNSAVSNSSGVGARITPEVTPNSLFSVANLNNREHISDGNSDLGIVQITPNINSTVYANNSMYLGDGGDSKITLPDGTVVSVRKRRHSQQSNGLSRNAFNPEELISDQEDDIQDIDIDPSAGSIEQIDLSTVPVYSVSTYINSSDSEQREKTTYQITASASGAESENENRLRTKKRRFHRTEDDYSAKLYRVEKRRLQVEERRLVIEEQRLAIEKERLKIERLKVTQYRPDSRVGLPPSITLITNATSAAVGSTISDGARFGDTTAGAAADPGAAGAVAKKGDQTVDASVSELIRQFKVTPFVIKESPKVESTGAKGSAFDIVEPEICMDFEDGVGISY